MFAKDVESFEDVFYNSQSVCEGSDLVRLTWVKKEVVYNHDYSVVRSKDDVKKDDMGICHDFGMFFMIMIMEMCLLVNVVLTIIDSVYGDDNIDDII